MTKRGIKEAILCAHYVKAFPGSRKGKIRKVSWRDVMNTFLSSRTIRGLHLWMKEIFCEQGKVLSGIFCEK